MILDVELINRSQEFHSHPDQISDELRSLIDADCNIDSCVSVEQRTRLVLHEIV